MIAELILNIIIVGSLTGGLPILNWQEPIAREDGTLLKAGDILEYHVYYGDGMDYQKEIVVPANNILSVEIPIRPVMYCAVVTSVDQQRRESLYSTPTCWNGQNPSAPKNVIGKKT